MSGPPSRPTPPSRPQPVSHEGVTISGVRVAPVLQGTCSQDRWLATGRPRLGGHMSPGGSFALSASTSRSSGSPAAVHRTRAGGRTDMAAQDKIHAAGSRSSSREHSGSKIQGSCSFSAGSCNESFGAHVRSSRRAVKDGSEFMFSLRSSKSLSSSDGPLQASILEPDGISRPRHQDSTLSVHLRSPQSPSGSVEYTCTVSPSSTANVLPGSPLRRPLLDTKVSTKVVTTTVAWTPPAHAIELTPRRYSASGRLPGEVLKTDKREGQHRRSLTFTGAPLMATVPESSVHEGATVGSAIPESNSEQPEEQSELPEPKTMQPQCLEPRLEPPVEEAKETVRESSVDVRLKPGPEPSKSSDDIEMSDEPVVKSEGLQATSEYHRRSSAGHASSMALVLKDEPAQDATTRGAARSQPPPAEVSVTKEVPHLTYLDRASTSSKANDEITNPKENFPVTSQKALEVELGFVPTTDMDVAIKDKNRHSDLLSTPVGQHLPSIERGVLPAISSEHHRPFDVQPLDNLRKQPPERKEPVKEKEDDGGKTSGDVCASACVITFDDEVSFCGFFHVSRERDNVGLSRMLWSRMLDACQGKNVCTAMPQVRALPFLDRYHFHVSYWGDIIYCHVTLRRGSFPAPSASRDGVHVRDLDLKRDSEAVIEYDHGVFGFDRSYYLRVALAEEEQTVKVATVASSEGHVAVVGYVGVQADQRGRPALRWLLADGDEAALALMYAVVEACPKIREKGLVGAFYAASHATGVILNSVDKEFMEPWTLLYNKREPFLRYDKIVSLTLI
ncbi:hypothetical protein HPB52_020669 [Rhipicephalus sanguineus]|uniref:Uncharacterized protein n=1 Tax=Rhipicephalus sanguineus TaxID=34632 RepID=A0A9D4Q3D4_RHISA|nr:hypothetical protein HPB52_020669 [Rhipicephalus sanguineus]